MADLEQEWLKILDAIQKHVASKEFNGDLTKEEADALREMIKERTSPVARAYNGW